MTDTLHVPSLLWSNLYQNIYKVPFHTFGSAKKRHLRLKPCEINSVDCSVSVTLISGDASSEIQNVKAAHPLALIWGDPRPNSAVALSTQSSPTKSPFLHSPFSKRVKEENEVLLQDVIEIVSGNSTAAFQAFIAKNGRSCVPHASCCFSILTRKRSVDFYISSGGSSQMEDTIMAQAWVDSLKSVLRSFHQRQRTSVGLLQSSIETIRHRDQSKELFGAVTRADLAGLRYLLDNGVPIDLMDESGDTVLITACRLGLYEVCRLALHEYSAKNDPHPEFGQTALQVAVASGHAKIVKLLLDTAEPSGADKLISNHEDSNGEAPIHLAARCGNLKIMELLLTHGAQLDFVDRRGRTCLHCAAGSGHASCLEFALDFGADEFIEVKQDNGFTCLHLAIRANSTECVDILLQTGADPAAETSDGSNAYELASKQKNQSIMKLLLEYDVSSRDCSESYSDGSLESSISGEDIFRGLNTYNVTPAPKNFLPQMYERNEQTPSTYFTAQQTPGRLFSPQLMSPAHSMASYGHTGLFNQSLLGGYRYNTPSSAMPITELAYNESQFELNGDAWTICYTNEGYPYYFNSNTSVSTWDDPRIVLGQELENLPQHTVVSAGTPVTQGHGLNQSFQETNDIRTSISMSQTKPSSHNHMNELKSSAVSQESEKGNGPTLSTSQTELSQVTLSKPDVNKQLVKESKSIQPRNNSEVTGHDTNDPRAALMDMIKKRNTPKSETAVKARVKVQTTDPDVDDTTQNPRAALMDMLKKRNSLINGGVVVEGNNTPSETPIAGKQNNGPEDNKKCKDPRAPVNIIETKADGPNENSMPDPRAAMMAMLQKRNPGDSLSTLAKKSPKQPSKSVYKDESQHATGELKREKSLSKDELMKDPVLQKYVKMTSFGVPPEAVVQKMKQESVNLLKVDLFKEFHGLLPEEPPQKPLTRQQQNVPSKEDLMQDSVLSKYIRMTKVGVPIPAVCSKMTQDKVDLDKILMFNLAFGLVKTKSPKRSPIPPVPRSRRRASTALQKIHWNTVADETLLRNSVWASQTNDGSELDAADIQKLESLFASVQNNRATVAAKKETAKKDTKKKTSLIDPKRANNIAIALAQYRSFASYDELIHAVVTLDDQHLNIEKLSNMQLLLPKTEEISRLQQLCGKKIENLGRAEEFFLAVMKVPRFTQKLAAFIFSLQFEESTKALFSNLHVLSQACHEVINSKKLAIILRRFLAIGNVMNESAGKPIASGITLDSLIKTAKMKGSDGKTTILDSVISSKLDLADFRLEMPAMREAMRLDLADLNSNLKDIESGASAVDTAIKSEKSDVDSSENGLISEISEKFLQKLEPFHEHASREILNIKASFNHVEGRVLSLCSFFAEDPKTKASTIFGVLLEFSQLVERSAEQLKRREAMAKRRESLRTPVKTSRP